MIEHHPIIDRPSWLAMRRQDLTASDLGAVAGVDEYRTALSVFTEKRGMGMMSESAMMRRGRWLEFAAAAAIIESNPNWRVIDPRVYIRDPEIRLGCTPDRIAEDEDAPGLINLQIKSISRPTFEKWAGEPPLSYMLQTCAEGMLLEARISYLCVFVISTYEAELVLFEIPRHRGAEIRIRQSAVDFWRDMEAGRFPVPDFRRDGETISALYSMPKPGPALDLSGSNRIREVLEERAALKDRIKIDLEAVSALENEIKYEMGESELAKLPGWRLSWKEQTRRAYTVPENSFRALKITQQEGNAA